MRAFERLRKTRFVLAAVLLLVAVVVVFATTVAAAGGECGGPSTDGAGGD
ncbi:MAG: hypothetical protein ACYCW6_11820 [Candidatus Xenobia bacterium]